MQTTHSPAATGSGAETIKVWDLPLRLFHWLLAAGFASAYLTAEFHYGAIHELIGYALCVLLAARIYWGFRGSWYSRFSSFIFSPAETLAYVRTMFGKHPVKHYYGHNPAGTLMVFTLLTMLAAIFTTGLLTLAVIDFDGPLLALERQFSDEAAYAVREAHELLSNATLALVVLHLFGVAGGSIQHGENLARAMLTGAKRTYPGN